MHLLVSLALFFSLAQAEIRETKSMAEVLRAVDKDALLVFDIDNTLIEAKNALGSDQWYYFLVRKYKEIDGMKEEAAHEKATRVWNQAQGKIQVQPVEASAPQIVAEAQRKKIRTMALTARSFDVAERTFKQLDSVGINFRKNGLSDSDLSFVTENKSNFTEGVIFVGEHNNKGKVLVRFLRELKLTPKKIVFVDDKDYNVKNMEAALAEQKLPFLGFRYGAADAKVKEFNEETSNLRLFLGD